MFKSLAFWKKKTPLLTKNAPLENVTNIRAGPSLILYKFSNKFTTLKMETVARVCLKMKQEAISVSGKSISQQFRSLQKKQGIILERCFRREIFELRHDSLCSVLKSNYIKVHKIVIILGLPNFYQTQVRS